MTFAWASLDALDVLVEFTATADDEASLPRRQPLRSSQASHLPDRIQGLRLMALIARTNRVAPDAGVAALGTSPNDAALAFELFTAPAQLALVSDEQAHLLASLAIARSLAQGLWGAGIKRRRWTGSRAWPAQALLGDDKISGFFSGNAGGRKHASDGVREHHPPTAMKQFGLLTQGRNAVDCRAIRISPSTRERCPSGENEAVRVNPPSVHLLLRRLSSSAMLWLSRKSMNS